MPIMARKRKAKLSWPAKLKKLRAKWGTDGKPMTQAAAADKIGVTMRSWASWELGERTPLQPMQMLIDLLISQDD